MSEKKFSELIDSTIDDKYIEEASEAESFFARKKALLIRKRRFLRIIPVIAACLILVLALSVGGMLLVTNGPWNDEPEKGTNIDSDNGGSNTNGDTDADTDTDTDEFPDYGDDGDDDGENGSEDIDIWDYIHEITVPKSYVKIDRVEIANKVGTIFHTDSALLPNNEGSIAEITNVSLLDGTAFRIEYDHTGKNTRAGIMFAAKAPDGALWSDIPCYFVFINENGHLIIAKSENGVEKDLVYLAEKEIVNYRYGQSIHVTLEYDGTKSISVTAGETSVSAQGTLEKSGNKLGIYADVDSSIANLKMELTSNALSFQFRYGENFSIKNGELYIGYVGDKALAYKSLALIENIDFSSASKITISADVAVMQDLRDPTNASAGSQNLGFILSAYNDDQLMPLFWESPDCSYLKVFLTGHSAEILHGIWGKSSLVNTDGITEEKPLYNNKPEFKYEEYYNLKAVWDAKNYTLTSYINGELTQITTFKEYPLANKGSHIGIRTDSGDVYFTNFELHVQ